MSDESDRRQAEVTTLVEELQAGRRETAERLMRREDPDHTLQPTALVKEVVLRLLRPNALEGSRNRQDVQAIAAQAMKHILVDHAGRACERGCKSWPRHYRSQPR
jgi:ECF sigma factor